MRLLSYVFSITLVGLATNASATIILKMDTSQLVGRSDLIFVGKAIKTHSHWTADKKHIVTDTTFSVASGIKGATPKTIVIRRLGGSVGGIGMRVAGMPVFNKGDQVVVFSEKRRGHRYVVGMKQGVFKITKNSAGKQIVQADLNGLALARRTPQGPLKVLEKKSSIRPQLLGEFIQHIRETIARCAKESRRCRTD